MNSEKVKDFLLIEISELKEISEILREVSVLITTLIREKKISGQELMIIKEQQKEIDEIIENS